jgi:hypothetical protein
MASTNTEMTAQGTILALTDGVVKFAPSNTSYQVHLAAAGYDGPLNVPVQGVIRVNARKAYSVPSGGNFISPIYGPPKTIQGRVRAIEGNTIVVQAGMPIYVQLPAEASAVELANGVISVGSLVNVVAFPGATFEHRMRNAE